MIAFIVFSACSMERKDVVLRCFGEEITLDVTDSVNIEELGILNPHYMQYKDDFLIFHSMEGKQELQFLDLKSMVVHTRNVIGQGPNEMPRYSTVDTNVPDSYRFSDSRRGKIYEMNLTDLRNDSTTCHTLVHELPIHPDELLLRFIETGKYFYGIGVLQQGRIWLFNKQTSHVKYCGTYPMNDEVNVLDERHKGALFTSTLMQSDSKHLVVSCFGLIDFYEILDNDTLLLKKEQHYFFPKFDAQDYGGMIIFDRDDIHGFCGIDSDNHYVYVLYSGKNVKESGSDAYNCNNLLVYDWDGNPVRHYHLNKSLYEFSLCGNILYGLSREKDPKVYIYQLDK